MGTWVITTWQLEPGTRFLKRVIQQITSY